jgi:hypothetical protein
MTLNQIRDQICLQIFHDPQFGGPFRDAVRILKTRHRRWSARPALEAAFFKATNATATN